MKANMCSSAHRHRSDGLRENVWFSCVGANSFSPLWSWSKCLSGPDMNPGWLLVERLEEKVIYTHVPLAVISLDTKWPSKKCWWFWRPRGFGQTQHPGVACCFSTLFSVRVKMKSRAGHHCFCVHVTIKEWVRLNLKTVARCLFEGLLLFCMVWYFFGGTLMLYLMGNNSELSMRFENSGNKTELPTTLILCYILKLLL